MRDLLIATRNKGKVPEMQSGLHDLPFVCKSIADIAPDDAFEPSETGTTFEENAIMKAREYGRHFDMLTIADDSGLEVDALGGEPGVNTARYAPGTDADRYTFLLQKLKGVPEDERSARFVSVIAVYDPQSDKVETTRGECLGKITAAPRGANGFGYDPVFYVNELGHTYAEGTLEEKQSVDHRMKALRAMREVLLTHFV